MAELSYEPQKKLNKQPSKTKQLLKQPFLLMIILSIFAFFIIFAVYPLYQVLKVAVTGQEGFSFSHFFEMVTNQFFLQTMWNSVRLGIFSAVLGTAVGFLFAFAITRTEMKGKKFFHLIALLPIISPPFVIALSMILLFGRNGAISNGIFGLTNSNIYGLSSLVFIQTLAFFPIAYLSLRGVLESIDPALEDAALNMGASRWKVFRTITFPLALPGIFSSLLLVFIKSIEDFGNPMIIAGEYETLAVQAYLQITGMYNLNTGAFLALALLLPSLTAFLVQKYWISKKSYVTVTGKPSQASIKIHEKYIVYPLFGLCILATGTILLFYGSVAFGSFVKVWGVDHTLTLDNFRYVLTLGFNSIKNSLILATVSTPITAILGMVIAYLIIRKQFIGKKVLEVSTMLSFAVPGTVIGIGYILAFNQSPFLLTGTAAILIIAFTVRNITVGIEAGTNSLRQVDPSIEEASTNLGANGFQTFFKISLPLMRSALFSGLVYSFVKSMTQISAVIFLVSVHWNLMTVSILSQIESSRMGAAAAYVMILIFIILTAIGILQLFVNKLGPNQKRRK
ncbi:iron ABC transporter permease [Alkalihalobacillus sp. MEB130]|uniref:ABC transporter permease n=1 Tax=Alkalihalobacillus sp. MEB130 TaxID=2976704 RepID=UPI0028DE58E8|nr:iron ABC transporter permease [Alkalihalobacillus sp. MEB130]MDT8858942.1 iron ABC transporter permease [Alkalihalobacillus sp. MEB130]